MTQTTQHIITTQTFKFSGITFVQFPEPMSTFDYECSKTNRGFHNHSIRYAGNGELGARLQIHGVEKGKITLKTIVAFSEVDENRPVATAPIEKFQHAEFLAKCLQAQIQ